MTIESALGDALERVPGTQIMEAVSERLNRGSGADAVAPECLMRGLHFASE
jgi:hypothetical protein